MEKDSSILKFLTIFQEFENHRIIQFLKLTVLDVLQTRLLSKASVVAIRRIYAQGPPH